MSPQLIGMMSGLLVIISVIPYMVRVYQGKITPSITTWGLWSLIGLVMLLTYEGSGAKWNLVPAVLGFTNPIIVTIIAIRRKGGIDRFEKSDKWCIGISVSALVLWYLLRDQPEKMVVALTLAVIADMVAAYPQIKLSWKQPELDRPFAWVMYGIGYGLAIFAIEDKTFANYVLPLWMFFGASFIAFPLVRFQLRNRHALSEWI